MMDIPKEDVRLIQHDIQNLKEDVHDIKIAIIGEKDLGLDGLVGKFKKHQVQYETEKMGFDAEIRALKKRTSEIEQVNFKQITIASAVSATAGIGIGAWFKHLFTKMF